MRLIKREHLALLLLAQRLNPDYSNWYSVNSNETLCRCYLCNKQFTYPHFIDPLSKMMEHGLDHLKEYNLAAFI